MSQQTRPCFVRQPARFLLVDLSQPFDSITYKVLAEALTHFFSLACSLTGPCRLPFFGLCALGAYPEILFPLQTIRGNYGRLRGVLSELETCVQDLGRRTGQQSCVGQGVREAANAFNRQAQNMLQMAGYWTQLELTVLTSQSPITVLKQVEQAVANLSMDVLKKAQVLYVNSSDRVGRAGADAGLRDSQTSEDSTKGSDSDGSHGLVDCITIDEDALSLENFFKGWLQDCSTDVEHLHLILSKEKGSEIVLKCDLHERLLSSEQLPASENLIVRCDSPVTGRLGNLSTARGRTGNQPQVPLYRLSAVRRVSADGVCESVLHGMPVIVRPTSCWKIDWDDLETNQQHFIALCQLLREKNQYLLAKSEPPLAPLQPTSGFRYQVAPRWPRGYFLLLPSGGESMLLKAIGVAELTMPCDAPAGERALGDSLRAVGAALNKLEEADTYNPLLERSGLYECLEDQLFKNQPGGSAPKRKLPAPTIKAASAVPVRPVGQVTGSRPGPKESWDSGHVSGPSVSKRRQQPVSGRDFYSSSDFPTQL